MAITVTPKYKPFTYEELVKPLEGYWKKYDEAEKDLGDISTKLAALDYIVQSEPEDSPLRAKYSDYKTKLETAAVDLGQKGLNQNVRNLLKEVNTTFVKDISPIATQYARRQKLEDEQRKVKESKPSIYFSKRAAETSLAEMIDNPNWSYTSFVGDDITKAVQGMVSPVATILDKIFKDGDIEGYSILKSQYGITPEDVVQYYNGENGKLKEYFDKVKETVVKSYGVDTWNDQNALNTAYHYANIGIPKAIGKLPSQLVPPKKYIGRKEEEGGEKNPTNPAYPGSALNFDVSTRYTPDAQKAKTAELNDVYNQGIPSKDYRHEDVALMEANFKKQGLSDNADLADYEEYLKKLAEARSKDLVEGRTTPARKSIGYTLYQSRDSANNVNALREQYNHKYDSLEQKISLRDINNYREAVAKNKEFIKRYSIGDNSRMDNRTGLYADDIKTSMNIGTQLEKQQSQEEMFIGTHKWDADTKTAIVGQLKSQYETLVGAGNTEKDKNGLYQISFDNGNLGTQWVNPDKVPAKFWDNVDVVFTAQEGMLLRYTDPTSSKPTLYKLKGSDFTGDSQEVIDMYKESRNFSPESIKTYMEKTGDRELGEYTLSELLGRKQDSQLVKTLIKNRSIVRSATNRNYGIAYVHALYPIKDKDGNPQYTVAKVVVDLRTGEKISVTTVDNELGDDGLGYSLSTRYAQDKLQGIAYTKSNDALNLNTKAAQRTKGSNPIRDEYILE